MIPFHIGKVPFDNNDNIINYISDLGTGYYPSRDNNYIRDKTLGVGQIVARSTTGTYFDSAGVMQTATINSQRFEHDPSSGRSLGVLVEESRTNIRTFGADITNAVWSTTTLNTTGSPAYADQDVAPDGALSAERLIEDTTTQFHYAFSSSMGIAAGVTTSTSVFIRPGSRSHAWMHAYNAAFSTGSAYLFDLSLPQVVGTDNQPTAPLTKSSGITRISNAWTRAHLITQLDLTSAGLRVGAGPYNGITRFYAGNNASYVSVWGFQTEAAPYPLSYIHTTSTTVTRGRDENSDNLSSVWDTNQNSLIFQFRAPIAIATSTRTLACLDDGTADNRILLQSTNGLLNLIVTVGGAQQASMPLGYLSEYVDYSVVLSFSGGFLSGKLSGNGLRHAQATAMPSITTARLGHDTSFANYWNGCVGRYTHIPRALPIEHLVGLAP